MSRNTLISPRTLQLGPSSIEKGTLHFTVMQLGIGEETKEQITIHSYIEIHKDELLTNLSTAHKFFFITMILIHLIED